MLHRVVAPLMLAVVLAIAGHPAHVACDADTNPAPFPVPAGSMGWTLFGGDTIHAQPFVCNDSNDAVGTIGFALSIELLVHEAAHARGIRSESCAEMTADVGVYDMLRRFYGIPFFSPLSRLVGAQVLSITRTFAAEYQPEICWNSGEYG